MRKGKILYKKIPYCRSCFIIVEEIDSFPLEKFYTKYNHLSKINLNDEGEFVIYLESLKNNKKVK